MIGLFVQLNMEKNIDGLVSMALGRGTAELAVALGLKTGRLKK